MTPLVEQIFAAVCKIPKGKVASYGQIAIVAGLPRGARIVGYAVANSEKYGPLPAHRVVFRDGSLCQPHIFGPGMQRKLLEREGVGFLPNGCVDMDQYRWEA